MLHFEPTQTVVSDNSTFLAAQKLSSCGIDPCIDGKAVLEYVPKRKGRAERTAETLKREAMKMMPVCGSN